MLRASRARFRFLASAVAVVVLVWAPGSAPAQNTPEPSGDQLLEQATSAPQLRSYAVPVDFAVRVRTLIGFRAHAEGTAYYEAPAQIALVITKAGGLIGAFFRGNYRLDVVPQAWPYTYHVVGVTHAVSGGAPVLLLNAKPRAVSPTLNSVVFTLTTPALQPVDVVWRYDDGSWIRLACAYGTVGAYTLPHQAHITVNMPRYRLEADATYGTYALNAPVPPSVFAGAK